jgi:hypothetical protein
MTFFRQFIAPLLIVLVFLVALVAVSSRIFLPSDMAAPAPLEEMTSGKTQPTDSEAVAGLPPALSSLIRGLPDEPGMLERW